jgi:hypothetical protein
MAEFKAIPRRVYLQKAPLAAVKGHPSFKQVITLRLESMKFEERAALRVPLSSCIQLHILERCIMDLLLSTYVNKLGVALLSQKQHEHRKTWRFQEHVSGEPSCQLISTIRPPLAVGSLAMLQTAGKKAAFGLLDVPAGPETATSMDLHHFLVRIQLWLRLKEVLALMPPVWFLTATLWITNVQLCCAQPSLQQQHIATTPFLQHIRLLAPFHNFTLCPPRLMQRQVPPSVRLCGAPWRSLFHSYSNPALHPA